MSQENVEVILQGVEAINRRDADAFVALFSPSVEWEESGDVFPGLRGVHRGWAGVRKWFEEAIMELWESFHCGVEEITEASDGRVFGESLQAASAGPAASKLSFASGRSSGSQTARSKGVRSFGLGTRPSKPPGCGSRRCRRRTWKPSSERLKRTTVGTTTRCFKRSTLTSHWHGVMGVMFGGEATVFRGHAGVLEYLRDLEEGFTVRDIQWSELRDLGERIVVLGHVRGKGRESGIELDSQYGAVAEFRQGKIIRYRDYFDHSDALEAAGLSE